MARLEQQFRDLGAEVDSTQMKNLANEQLREPSVKKIRVGKSPSLVGRRPLSRDLQGFSDAKVRISFYRIYIGLLNLIFNAIFCPQFAWRCSIGESIAFRQSTEAVLVG